MTGQVMRGVLEINSIKKVAELAAETFDGARWHHTIPLRRPAPGARL